MTNDIRLYSLETDGFEPELYLLRAAQKRKGIVPKAQNGKGNETQSHIWNPTRLSEIVCYLVSWGARVLAGPLLVPFQKSGLKGVVAGINGPLY